MRLIQIVKLTPHMSPTRGLKDPAAFVKPVEAGIAIGLQDATVVFEMIRRMLAFAIRRISEPHRRWRFAASRAVIANVGPQAASLCFTVARFQHRYRHIVAVQFLRAEYILLQLIDQGP